MSGTSTNADIELRIEDLEFVRLLSPEVGRVVAGCMVRETFKFGETIVKSGQAGDAWYAILMGRARVVNVDERGEELTLDMLRPGDSFGELALLGGGVRTATVRASSEVVTARLDGAMFRSLLQTYPDLTDYVGGHARFRAHRVLLRSHPLLGRLSGATHFKLLKNADIVELRRGDRLFSEGDPAGPMFLVESGRLRAFLTGPEGDRPLNFFRRGDILGERSVILGQPRSASIDALTDVTLVRFNLEGFQALLASDASFRAEIKRRAEEMRFDEVARVPIDFEQELLPSSARTVEPEPEPTPAVATEAGPFASPEGYFVKRGVIKRFPNVLQIDEMDCGAASLAMVCQYHGRRVPLAEIRQLLNTSTDGTRLSALVRGAEQLGLAARSVKASVSRLDDLPLPAIVHWEGVHWMVLYRVTRDKVYVADPAQGHRELTREAFEKAWTGYAALFDYTEAFGKAPGAKVDVRWMMALVEPHLGTLGTVLGLAGLVSALEMVMPVFSQVIVDRVLVDRDVGLLSLLVAGMLGVLAFMTVGELLQRYLISFVAVRVDASSLDYLSRRLLALPMSYFLARRTGDIQRRLGGLRGLREFVVSRGLSTITDVGQLTAAMTVMLIYSPKLTLVFCATVPIYVVMMKVSSARLRPMFADLEESFGHYASRQIDAIKGIETVKALGAERRLRQVLLEDFLQMSGRQFDTDFTAMAYQGGIQTVSILTSTAFLWAGAYQVIDGSLTIGSLFAFQSLVAMANGPVLQLVGTWDQLQHVQVLLDRLADIFATKPEMPEDRAGRAPVRRLNGEIEFRHVSFRFGGPESPLILDDVSFVVPAGKTIAIVGRSGSGKTTLIKCLAGLMLPTEGTILFDGVDINQLDLRDLRRNIGFVLQESFLFNDTIARNIAFADDTPDPERVASAAHVASAHEFITRLPLGYETKVGESGLRLSGGQQQRISIARALYNRPNVLIFDEATSALDTESERAIQQNMTQLLEGRTAFIIAHRLSTIRNADRILVLEKGRLAEAGDHDELMARQGLYFYLCSQQLGL